MLASLAIFFLNETFLLFLNTVLLKLILEGKQLQKTDRNELHTIFNFKCCFIFRRHTQKINVPHFEVKKCDLNLSRLQLGSLKKEDEKEEVREEPIRRSDHNSKLGNPRRKITAREC